MNKYEISALTVNAVIDLDKEARRLFDEDTKQTVITSVDDLRAVATAVKEMIKTSKPSVMRDVKDALIHAPSITPEDIDLYIPHVNTPKTVERFMALSENGLPCLKGFWLLTDYSSCEFDYGGVEVIVCEETENSSLLELAQLHKSISKLFYPIGWTRHGLREDVLCTDSIGFKPELVREILEGRVIKVYLDSVASVEKCGRCENE